MVEEKLALRNRIIGLLLRDARERAEKTKRECAVALGVSTGTITAYEEGRKAISLPEIEVLAYVLDTPVSHFWEHDPDFEAEEEPPPLQEVLALRHRIVGALLRQARLEADVSQKELAEVLGCSGSTISSYEFGKRPISLQNWSCWRSICACPWSISWTIRKGQWGNGRDSRRPMSGFWSFPGKCRTLSRCPSTSSI